MDSIHKYPILYECGHTVCVQCFESKKEACPFCFEANKEPEVKINIGMLKQMESVAYSTNNKQNNNKDPIEENQKNEKIKKRKEKNNKNEKRKEKKYSSSSSSSSNSNSEDEKGSENSYSNTNSNQNCNENDEDYYKEEIRFRCPIGQGFLYFCAKSSQNDDHENQCTKCSEKSDFYLQCEKHKVLVCLKNKNCAKEVNTVYFEKQDFENKNKCITGHPLAWSSKTAHMCFECMQTSKYGLSCKKCQGFFVCFKCCIYEDANKRKCLNEHSLTWNGEKQQICFECEESKKTSGLSCKKCDGFFICDKCADFKFPKSACPNNHELKFANDQKRKCSRCEASDLCSVCLKCEYFLCVICVDAFDKSKNKSGSLSVIKSETFKKNFLLSGHLKSVTCIALVSENQIASGSQDNTVKVWDMKSKQLTHVFNGHSDFVTCLILIDVNRFISGSRDRTIKLWDSRSKQNLVNFDQAHSDAVTCLALVNNNQFASGSEDRKIKMWKLNSYECLHTFSGHADYVNCLALVNKSQLASGSSDKTIRFWDLSEKKLVKTIMGHTGDVLTLALVGSDFLASGSADKTIRLWNLNTKSCSNIFDGHKASVTCLASLNKNFLASGSNDNNIKLWDVAKKKCVNTLNGHTNNVRCIAFTNRNQLISGSEDMNVRFWKLNVQQTNNNKVDDFGPRKENPINNLEIGPILIPAPKKEDDNQETQIGNNTDKNNNNNNKNQKNKNKINCHCSIL